MSPNLQTTQRMKLKDDFSIASAEQLNESSKKRQSNFKARPFDKKKFEKQTRLPSILKKTATEFTEFRLSKSNMKLGKKTFEEYVHNKENVETAFRARSLDRRIFEENAAKKFQTETKKKVTLQTQFNFKTEERLTRRKGPERLSNSADQRGSEQQEFRARAMPKYQFFEVKHEPHKKILFQEFNLCTERRVSAKKRSSSSDETMKQETEEHKFKALPMPNFQDLKPKTCQKKTAQKHSSEPFKLLTENRGLEKQQKWQQLLE